MKFSGSKPRYHLMTGLRAVKTRRRMIEDEVCPALPWPAASPGGPSEGNVYSSSSAKYIYILGPIKKYKKIKLIMPETIANIPLYSIRHIQ